MEWRQKGADEGGGGVRRDGFGVRAKGGMGESTEGGPQAVNSGKSRVNNAGKPRQGGSEGPFKDSGGKSRQIEAGKSAKDNGGGFRQGNGGGPRRDPGGGPRPDTGGGPQHGSGGGIQFDTGGEVGPRQGLGGGSHQVRPGGGRGFPREQQGGGGFSSLVGNTLVAAVHQQQLQYHQYQQLPVMLKGCVMTARVLELHESGHRLEVAIPDGRGLAMALMPGFRFNARQRRPYICGDELQVTCPSEMVGSSGLREVCPTSAFVRPLIILDINGVLGVREAYNSAQPSRNRRFIVRDSAPEFVASCAELFEIAIWSCSKRQNLLDDIRILFRDARLHHSCLPDPAGLCFIWDQEHSTNLWPRTSIVNEKKPLFLKELSKVWENYPCFAAKNTVLIDNHVEKFERNPLGTCIAIGEFTERTEDGALDRDSELLVHLAAMAENGADTQRYINERAGISDLFLEAYPVPPCEESTSLIDIGALTLNDPPQQQLLPLRPKQDICRKFLELTRHADEVEYWVQRRELPSTRALNLRRHALEALLQSCDFSVCEKTDGVRYCLVTTREGRFCLLDRAMQPAECVVGAALSDWLSGRTGDTVLDGELVLDQRTNLHEFVVFDAIVVDGQRTGLLHSFMQRLAAAKVWLDAMHSAKLELPFNMIIKRQVHCARLAQVTACFSDSPDGHGWVFDDGVSRHCTDGLIFTPTTSSYYKCMPYKWKPVELMTVDFLVAVADIFKGTGPYRALCKTQEGMVPVCDVFVDKSLPWVKDLLEASRGSNAVLECIFLPAEGIWRAVKDRRDKNTPNSLFTAFSSLEAVAEGLSLDALVARVEMASTAEMVSSSGIDPADRLTSYTNLSHSVMARTSGRRQAPLASALSSRAPQLQAQLLPPPIPTQTLVSESVDRPVRVDSVKDGAVLALQGMVESKGGALLAVQGIVESKGSIEAEVGSHYDRIQLERWEGGKKSLDVRIAVLRKFQNWNKACMIKRLQETTFDSRGDLDSLIAALHVDITIAVIDPMQRFSSNVKAIMKKSRVPFRVLDLACGRGGDLNKWTRDCEVKLYVGVDISVEELKEAKQRAETFKGSSAFHFFRSSCDSPTLLQDLKPIVGAGHKQDARAGGVAASMHVVWCQFALHYFCETRASLSAFLKNVSGALTRGGRFCASFPNPCAVIGHLNQTHLTGQCTSGNSICFVSAGAGVILPIAEDVGLREFGIAYNFTLGDAVQECAEYVVPLRVLVELAAEAGLKLKRLQQMHAFMAQCAEDEELVSLREVMQLVGPKSPGRPLSVEEWEAIGLYCVAVWEKA